jgi:hypothetical protein
MPVILKMLRLFIIGHLTHFTISLRKDWFVDNDFKRKSIILRINENSQKPIIKLINLVAN